MSRGKRKGETASGGADDLRKRAEEILRKRVGSVEPADLSTEEARRLVNELQVHQIELEMQNEELRRAQVELEESRRNYIDLYDFAPVGYFTFDREGVILEVNLTGASLLGVERSLLIKQPFAIYVERGYQDTFYIHRKKVFESEERQACELKLKRRDHSEFYVRVESAYVEDRNTCRSSISDITERKMGEKELSQYRQNLERMVEERTYSLGKLNRELEREIASRKKMEDEIVRAQKLESVGVLAGGLAHDFNNALAAIMNNVAAAAMLLSNKADVGKALNTLEAASKAVRRAASMTQQLLTFARGGEPIRRTSYLRDLIRDTAEFSLRGTKVVYEFKIEENIWPADVDEGQISQVISNLVINAVQAMAEGGKIEISAENVNLKKTHDLPLEPGKYIMIKVKDNGPGILKKDISKIFDPYFTTKESGSGLGLATAYSIVAKHGGYIAVESKTGKGTTFTVYLPASKEQVVKTGLVGQREFKSGKILVMDDEEDVRDSVEMMLKLHGYKADFTKDGAEAIKAYKSAMKSGKPYDAVVMDLTVRGGMGGEEAMKKIQEVFPDVKAVVASGYSNDPVMADYKKYGFVAALPKPYDVADLSKILQTIIRSRQ